MAQAGAATPVSSPVADLTGQLETPEKVTGNGVVFCRGSVKVPINYAPNECTELPLSIPGPDRVELMRQQQAFKIFPSGRGGEGNIRDYARDIPYMSNKKTFNNRTGKTVLHVFLYTFQVPDDPERQTHTIMWDYEHGLVRVTACFRALNHAKTVPKRSLKMNPGLEDISHSITGGAIIAQGYWLPMACARALCLTFCHKIRWALTPVFGPTFAFECLSPDDPEFEKFRIEPETLRAIIAQADGVRKTATPAETSPLAIDETQSILATPRGLRRRPARSTAGGIPFVTPSHQKRPIRDRRPSSRLQDLPLPTPTTGKANRRLTCSQDASAQIANFRESSSAASFGGSPGQHSSQPSTTHAESPSASFHHFKIDAHQNRNRHSPSRLIRSPTPSPRTVQHIGFTSINRGPTNSQPNAAATSNSVETPSPLLKRRRSARLHQHPLVPRRSSPGPSDPDADSASSSSVSPPTADRHNQERARHDASPTPTATRRKVPGGSSSTPSDTAKAPTTPRKPPRAAATTAPLALSPVRMGPIPETFTHEDYKAALTLLRLVRADAELARPAAKEGEE